MKLPNPTNKTVYAGKLKLEYTEAGSGSPIVFLHGLFGNLSNWTETLDFFSKTNRVIIPSLPIYNSSWTKDVLNELVDYVHALTDKLELKNIILVGHSLGGHVAILYTLAHQQNVSKLVLTGSAGLFENGIGISYPKRGDYAYISERVKYTFHNEEVASESLIEEVFKTVNDIRKSIGVLKVAKATNRNNVANELVHIKVPTLLIWGKQDRITSVEVALQFKDLLGGKVELQLIDNCGHAPMMEQPHEFNSILNEYIRHKYAESSLLERIDKVA